MRHAPLAVARPIRGGVALEPFLKNLAAFAPQRVEGTAVFMSGGVD
jgi:K+ transporter